MKSEALLVQLTGWFLLAFSLFQVISRSTWMSSDGMPLPDSDGVPYGILCGMGFIAAGRVLARIEATLAKQEEPPSR